MQLTNLSKRTIFIIGIIVGLVFSLGTGLFLTAKPFLTTGGKTSLKKESYHTNIYNDTKENINFRKVLFTGNNSQLVIMSIPPGGEVGEEIHTYTEQTLFFLSGTGEGFFDSEKFPIVPGDVTVVVPGTKHNFKNTGSEDLKIYTVYASPNHIDGRIHQTKAAADADTADEAIGETKPLCK